MLSCHGTGQLHTRLYHMTFEWHSGRGQVINQDRWCKREHVESNALNSWKLNIFKIIDCRISFYCNN